MTCADFQNRISPYLDGELSHWARWKVQNHLRHCPECAAMLEDLESVDLCLRDALTANPAPQYLTDAVMRRLPAMPPAWRRTGSTLTWSAGLAVVGMQLLALCGAYWWGFSRGTETGPRVDRTGILSPPPGPMRAPHAEIKTPANYPASEGRVGAGVWGKPISVINDSSLAPSAVEHAEPVRKPVRKPTPYTGSFGPQLQMEGAR